MATANKHKSTAKKKIRTNISRGRVVIIATFNNTIVTVTDPEGNVLGQDSAGKHFKGARKSTPFAAQMAAKKVCEKIKALYKLREVEVIVKGVGNAKESAATAVGSFFDIIKIEDKTPIAHNGVRGENERRV